MDPFWRSRYRWCTLSKMVSDVNLLICWWRDYMIILSSIHVYLSVIHFLGSTQYLCIQSMYVTVNPLVLTTCFWDPKDYFSGSSPTGFCLFVGRWHTGFYLRSNPNPLPWKHRALTTGLPEKSHALFFFFFFDHQKLPHSFPRYFKSWFSRYELAQLINRLIPASSEFWRLSSHKSFSWLRKLLL